MDHLTGPSLLVRIWDSDTQAEGVNFGGKVCRSVPEMLLFLSSLALPGGPGGLRAVGTSGHQPAGGLSPAHSLVLSIGRQRCPGGSIWRTFWVPGHSKRPAFPVPTRGSLPMPPTCSLVVPHGQRSASGSASIPFPHCPQSTAAHPLIPDLRTISASLCILLSSQDHFEMGLFA